MSLAGNRLLTLAHFLKRIEVDEEARAEAQTALDRLWPTLVRKAEERKFPRHFEVFLTGSFARETKNYPLDDIDLFYVFGKANRLPNEESYQLTDLPFAFPWDFYSPPSQNLSSIKVTNLFKRGIAETYSRSDVARDGECVNIFLESYSLGFDIVPALFIENTGYYAIPMGGGSELWKPANPRKDAEILSALDRFHSNTVRPVIRIAKYWFRKKRIRSPRSYHLEGMIYHLFEACKTPIQSTREALALYFANVNYAEYLASCPDPTGFSAPLTSGLDWQDILSIRLEAITAIAVLNQGEAAFVRYLEPNI